MTWTAVSAIWPAEGEPEWSERLETLADVFASHLLLPAAEVNAQLDALTDGGRELSPTDIVALARDFDVSTEALAWRVVNLGRRDATWAKSLLNDADFRRRDRVTMPRWTQPEVPFSERYVRLAFLAHEKEMIGLSRLATLLESNMGDVHHQLEQLRGEESPAASAP